MLLLAPPSSPRDVSREVAAVGDTAAHISCRASRLMFPLFPWPAAVVASAARSCLEEAVEADSVEEPVAKAKAG